MSNPRRAMTLGFLMWLLPFVVAVLAYPFHEANRPLFESVMLVTVPGVAVLLGLAYWRGAERVSAREGLVVGLLWMVISLAIDAPLMLLGGPMQMGGGEYLADIGLGYAIVPIVLWGLGRSAERAAA